MSRLFIFAIGGSGSRVLRSLTMLMASGVEIEYDVIPMIIDPDTRNGDLQRTVNELRWYNQLRNHLTFNDETKNRFFHANIQSLDNDGNFLLPLNGTANISFDSYMNLSSMSKQNQAMMRMLFSNDNLSSNMNVGFKGNPNIGSVVLNQFTQSSNYHKFETNFVAGDRIFIISSIFGGTGASGFPLLLKTIRTSSNQALKDSMIGAVSLLPYFNLKSDPQNSKIQADSFITKMKAALNYYERNVTGNNTLDDMYYLGDVIPSHTYNNCDGGQNQINDAHIIELIASLSIIDFMKKQNINGNHTTVFHEFGLKTQPTGNVIFSDFGENTREIIVKPLSQMAIMNSYLIKNKVTYMEEQRWAKDDNNLLGNLLKGNFFNEYKNFMGDGNGQGFEDWLLQLASNQMGFEPFTKNTYLKNKEGLNKVIGYPPKYKVSDFFNKGFDYINNKLSENYNKISKGLNAPSKFMELFYITTQEICNKNLNIQ